MKHQKWAHNLTPTCYEAPKVGFLALWANVYGMYVSVMTVAMVKTLRDFGPYGLICITACLLF
jgi:hypothetical protein